MPTAVGEAELVAIERIAPNEWNPNVQPDWIYQKELASIQRYGFLDPVIVREIGDGYEIIDGEHRWRAARELGMASIPIWNVGQMADDLARELTIVLNETRGQADRNRLSALLKDLASRRDEQELRAVMPFSRERFDELLDKMRIDWQQLEQRRPQNATKWVERVFRMPADAAQVVDDALERIQEEEGISEQWRALEFLAADYSSG